MCSTGPLHCTLGSGLDTAVQGRSVSAKFTPIVRYITAKTRASSIVFLQFTSPHTVTWP